MSGRPRLMIVDDDAATRAALHEALSMEGMDIVAECEDATRHGQWLAPSGVELVAQ